MNEEERMAYNAAQDIPDDGYINENEPMNINDVLDGTAELNLSHAGGEFQLIVEEELYQQHSYVFFSYNVWTFFKFIIRRPRIDPRTRQNRTLLRNEGFKRQFEGIVDAYMLWSKVIGDGGLDSPSPSVEPELLQGTYKIRVMDVFGNNVFVYTLHISSAS
jgi:hypothetical protein